MKKFLLIAIATIFSVALLKAGDERHITFQQLPAPAQTFIKNYFSVNDIASVKIRHDRMKEYKVLFKNGSKVDFDAHGEWIKIKTRDKGIPKKAIPVHVLVYVHENYPQNLIMEIERHGKRHTVELSNGIELKFNSKGELVKIDD